MQGIINWESSKAPSASGIYNIIYMDVISRVYHIGFAKYDKTYNTWKDVDGKHFTKGIVKYYGNPELMTESENIYFTTKIAHKLCGVKSRAFQYWIHDNKIDGMRDKAGGRWLFSLNEINRIRQERGMKLLTYREARTIWEQEIANKKYGIQK